MAAPPIAVTFDSPSVHQVPPGEKLSRNTQQQHMMQRVLPQTAGHPQLGVVYPPPYQELGSVAAVQYVVSLSTCIGQNY